MAGPRSGSGRGSSPRRHIALRYRCHSAPAPLSDPGLQRSYALVPLTLYCQLVCQSGVQLPDFLPEPPIGQQPHPLSDLVRVIRPEEEPDFFQELLTLGGHRNLGFPDRGRTLSMSSVLSKIGTVG